MANLTGIFDTQAEAQQDFAPIPSGKYSAQIVESDMKPTKNNTGQYLELEYQVLDGPFANRKVWVRLNLDNPNAQAVEIANRQFASIREATGVANPSKSEELHYKAHVIRVEMIPAGTPQKHKPPTQKDANEIRGWEKLDGAPTFAQPQQNGAAQSSATTTSPSSAAPMQNAAPWANKAA